MTKESGCNEADQMQNLYVTREVRSGYCWTKRHKKCKHTERACHCLCHNNWRKV